ncbi:MAG: hypothetical protein WCF57_21580 [Pyrinomonadaceae bacterium]
MATKTEKTNGKQNAPSSALLAYGAHLGPAFAGAGPFNGSWSKFPYPPPTSPCPGFWSAVRHYPLNGGMVAQVGAHPGTGSALCGQHVGFQYAFTAPLACEMVFNLTLNLGPVTRVPRGGQVSAWATLQLTRGDGGYCCPPDINYDVPSNTGITLCIRPQIQARQRYILTFGILPIVQNAGYQSYGEIIANSANLEARYPYGVQVAQALRFDSAEKDERLMAFVNSGGKQKSQEISMEQALTVGSPQTV